MQDAHLTETEQSLVPIRPQQRQRQNQQFDRGENFDYCVESHGERQHLHLHAHLQLRKGKRVGGHANLHHLRKIEDFGFLESRKSTGGADRTPTLHTHLCNTVCSWARNTHPQPRRTLLLFQWMCVEKIRMFRNLKRKDQRVTHRRVAQALPLAADSTKERRSENKDGTVKHKHIGAPSAPRSSWQTVGQLDASSWKLSGTEGTTASWENRRKHCLSLCEGAISFTQKSSVPCLNVWNCRIPPERSYHVMRKTFPSSETVLLRGWTQTLTMPQNDMVDVRKGLRGTWWSICSKAGRTCSIVFLRQQRVKPVIRSEEASIYNWNPGPRREKEDAIEKQIAGKFVTISLWSISTLRTNSSFLRSLLFVSRWFFHSVEKTKRGNARTSSGMCVASSSWMIVTSWSPEW